MGMLVGASTVIDLRILGVAPTLPLAQLKRLYSFIWAGFWIQVVSGVLLLIAYPTKALTNLDFYLKLALIALAMVVMLRLKTAVLDNSSLSDADIVAKGKAFAAWSLVLWVAAITAGRFLAYTYTYVTYPEDQTSRLFNVPVMLFHLLASRVG
jgi:hypothetical protein